MKFNPFWLPITILIWIQYFRLTAIYDYAWYNYVLEAVILILAYVFTWLTFGKDNKK